MKTDLKVGDPVVLDDCFEGYGKKIAGVGYKVTAVTDKFIECTNWNAKSINRTKYYGQNDLHLVKKAS